MQAFLKTVKSTNNNRHVDIKRSITTELSDSLKEIQLSSTEDSGSDEGKVNLCSAIEAIFLHGLRDSLAHRFRRALADVDQPPDPNFWSPLLVISHREIIDQISSLTQITTEIGQCRAWIRLALNESLLSSYLMTIRQDPSALKPYYSPNAYVRDIDVLEVAQRLIEGVEAISLNLPANSSLLNFWPAPSLIMAGIWSPTLKNIPIAAGVDVAISINSASSVNSETASIASMASQNSGIGKMSELNQDDLLKIILDQHSDAEESVLSEPEEAVAAPQQDVPIPSSNLGNSLNRQSGWSFNESSANEAEAAVSPEAEVTENGKSMEDSFNEIIQSTLFSGSHIRTPDFKLWHRLEPSGERSQSESPSKSVKDIPTPRNQPLALAAQVTLIAREKGLDNQNYECNACKEPLPLASKFRVCAFTAEYFCDTCMAPESIPIPARIIHNWDFKKHPVSQKAFNCLEEIKDHPVIDFKTANPFIYTAVEEMARLQTLRNQLNYLRAYLYTCKEPIIEQLQKQMWPREYMYEHIHQYSISDLLQIRDGDLAKQLEKVVEFGKDHVLKCWLCSQKGFLCEICNKSKALFPFDTDNVYRCNSCSGVYHKSCLNALKPCPRCKRKKIRDDLQFDGSE